jgi:hypothetical protein
MIMLERNKKIKRKPNRVLISEQEGEGTGLRGRLGTRRRPVEEGGRAGSRGSCPSGPLIYLSTLPGQPSINPIYPHSQLLTVVPPSCLLCKVAGPLGGQTPSALRQPPHGGESNSVAVSNPISAATKRCKKNSPSISVASAEEEQMNTAKLDHTRF